MAPERERAIGAAEEVLARWMPSRSHGYRRDAAWYTAEAILALPDPVRAREKAIEDAAREVVEGWDRWQLESGPGLRVNTAVGRHRTKDAIARLRAALEEGS